MALDQTIQRLFQIAYRLIGAAPVERLIDAVIDMLLQDHLADLVERRTHGGDLREHVLTVPPFLPQPFQAGSVPGDARQAFRDLLAGRLAVVRHGSPSEPIHLPPWGDG